MANGVTLVNGLRLTDQPYSSNPEFSLHGNTPTAVSMDCWSSQPARERDAALNQRNSNVQFQFGGVTVYDPAQKALGSQIPVYFSAFDKYGNVGGFPPYPVDLRGNLGTAEVASGGCSVSGDGLASPANSATVSVGPANLYRVYITTPEGVTSGNCSIILTPLIPTDRSLSPSVPGGAPLSLGAPQTFVVTIGQ